jgi:hypothetical protein
MRYLQTGLILNDPARAAPGFTLFSPMYGNKSYLIDMAGRAVREWTLPGAVHSYARLLPGGNLLASLHTEGGPSDLAGKGGHFVELDPAGRIVWEYRDDFQHHDVRRLANGNTIYIAWERLSPELTATIRGGLPGSDYKEGIWGDVIREVDPSGTLVWEWHARENFDFTKYPLKPDTARHEYAHPNALCTLPDGNCLVSFRQIDVIAIISRVDGKIVWERHEPKWGGQHDAQMLANGNILLFANRLNLGPVRGSAVIEFDPRTNATVWEYMAKPTHTFDSHFISGAQRLENGNTVICEGLWGRFFEVTPSGDIVWEYISPYFTLDAPGVRRPNVNYVFRALRYAPDAPELRKLIS